MKKNISKNLAKRKKNIAKRVKKRNWDSQPKPMLNGSNIVYDVDGRHKGIAAGGIGIIHMLSQKSGLIHGINDRIGLFKRHLPYHESDHITNLAYNVLAGGTCLQDIELRRNDEAWLDALGAEIIPDPTTAGDFLRRFTEEDIIELMEVKNSIRRNIWKQQKKSFFKEAIIDVDGTLCPTWGECKEGMDISYKGDWGYHPLIISLSNTREPLYLVNRSGNVPSHQDSAPWIDRSLELVGGSFKKISVRGDTDFSLTAHFDKWDKQCRFFFGMDAMPNLVSIAQGLPESIWQRLDRRIGHTAETRARKRPENIKDQIVKKRKYKKIVTVSEQIAEFDYRPGKCKKTYRIVALRKNMDVIRGEQLLFDDVRYFFYITNDRALSAADVVHFARGRCDHENDIDQLKNGVGAMRMPSDSMLSNWAYMVIASLAWDLKAWYGLLIPNRQLGRHIIRMEFKRFINCFIMIPCLIVKSARRIRYRLIGYNDQAKDALRLFSKLKAFGFT